MHLLSSAQLCFVSIDHGNIAFVEDSRLTRDPHSDMCLQRWAISELKNCMRVWVDVTVNRTW